MHRPTDRGPILTWCNVPNKGFKTTPASIWTCGKPDKVRQTWIQEPHILKLNPTQKKEDAVFSSFLRRSHLVDLTHLTQLTLLHKMHESTNSAHGKKTVAHAKTTQ